MSHTDHPQRFELNNEIHARPFPEIRGPARVMFLAYKAKASDERQNRTAERSHLIALLDRFGVDHPTPDATHFYGNLGRIWLKWEQHTEFTTYTVIQDGPDTGEFDPKLYEALPPEWVDDIPGYRVAAALVRVEKTLAETTINTRLRNWFVQESLSVSEVLDQSAVIASDFRIDENGYTRMAVFPAKSVGKGRIGRLVQRMTEIEVYKTISMIGFVHARGLGRDLTQIDRDLAQQAERLGDHDAETSLGDILNITSKLEQLTAKSAFRFAATRAYAALVGQRIDVLREAPFGGRQTFTEFMMRRFDPAMRTVDAVDQRLRELSQRAIRNGELLRTRVDVERQKQNQTLLESMNSRADAQLKLQKTVEGLSVVAISYYAVNLVLYLLGPFPSSIGISKLLTGTLVTPIVVFVVWLMIRRIHKSMH